jgi:hypothetical protein
MRATQTDAARSQKWFDILFCTISADFTWVARTPAGHDK